MKKKTIHYLFPKAKIIVNKANKKEVREGWLIFKKRRFLIKQGIICDRSLSKDILRESKAVKYIDKKPVLGGSGQVLKKVFFDALESLPRSKENPLFAQPGSFLNISLGATDYFKILKKLSKKLIILEIGADSGWSCAQFVKRGHSVVGLDINDHLFLRDFWIKKGVYFESVLSDMNKLPFGDSLFDLVFASASIHHSRNLKGLGQQIWRVLKPGGHFVFLREPMKGQWAQGQFGKAQRDLGVSENIYSFSRWENAFKKAGFKNLKIELAALEYHKIRTKLPLKDQLIFEVKDYKKRLLKHLPFLRDLTISDFNFSGQKPKK